MPVPPPCPACPQTETLTPSASLEDECIRDNFVIIYELLDETMDHGYPQALDSKILRQFITQEGNRMEQAAKPPVALTNAVSWRNEGIKHKKNEIFLDVVEKVRRRAVNDTFRVRSDEQRRRNIRSVSSLRSSRRSLLYFLTTPPSRLASRLASLAAPFLPNPTNLHPLTSTPTPSSTFSSAPTVPSSTPRSSGR